jgi:hypothetical protein
MPYQLTPRLLRLPLLRLRLLCLRLTMPRCLRLSLNLSLALRSHQLR